jgi:tetratricopeptide (TPR) repeat protein
MPTDQKELTPYVGPRPFERTTQDRARFFGRDQETQEIVSLIFGHPLVLVYAQSGAGKTSLFNAKVVPTLEENGFKVLPPTRVRGAVPQGIEPQDIANLYVFNALLHLEPEADPQALADKSLVAFLEERPRTDEAGEKPIPRAIIFDQFEEIFTLYPERWYEQQEAFFHQVAEALAADPLLRVVFVIREEYLARLDPFARLLPERLRTRFRLERLHQGAALAAVTGPLAGIKRSFAEGVAEQLVEELLKIRVETATGKTKVVTGEFVEPVQLQVVCQSLWRDLPPDVTIITEDHLRAFGDVNQALSEFYERSVKRATRKPGVREGALRAWFERTLITPAGTRGMVYRGRRKTGKIPNVAVDVLENLHLIRGEWRAGARWYELTHDRFIGPIQTSNEAWHVARRRRWLRIGEAIAVVLIFLLMGIVALRTTETDQRSQAQATVEAAADDYMRQGLTYSEQGDYAQAIADFTKAIELDPNNATAYFNRGLAQVNLGDPEQAIADFTKAIELDPDHALAYNNRGDVYYKAGDYAQAIADFTKAIELDPNDAIAYFHRGSVYDEQNNYEEAIADFTKAIELKHDPLSWPYFNRGTVYYEQNDYEEAIADYTKAIELDYDPLSRPYFNRGNAYYKLGDYEQAIADFTKVIELDPGDALAYNNRGDAYYELGDYEQAIVDYSNTGNAYRDLGDYSQAIVHYTEAIELDPNDATAYFHRGFAYYERGDYEEAIADFTKAIELKHDPLSWPYFNRGNAYYKLGDYEQAIADFTTTTKLAPEEAKPYNNRGRAYYELGDYEEAVADFTKAIELDPNYAKAYDNRGNAYLEQGDVEGAANDYVRQGLIYAELGDYGQAITAYTKAIEVAPGYARAYNNRGNAYRKLGDYEQAIADYAEAIELDPSDALTYRNRGLAYQDLGDYGQAITDFTKAIELDPSDALAYNSRGIAYRGQGDYEQAIADYTKAIELDPDYAVAYNNRGFALNEREEYDLAISDFTRAIELDPDYAFPYSNRGWAYSQLGYYERAFRDFEDSVELNPNNPWVYYHRGLTYADREDTENAIADLEKALQLSEPPLDENRLDIARATLEGLRGQ